MIASLVAGFLMMPTPVMERGEWLTDWEKARRYSSATGKPILANFTGSDWCPYCLRLKESVFDSQLFLEWSADNVILFEADFPRKKELPAELRKQNDDLVTEFGVAGYPAVLFVTGGGDVLGRSGYLPNGAARTWVETAEYKIEQGREALAEMNGAPEIVGKDLKATDFRGKKLADYELGESVWGKVPSTEGKVVLVDFWATWCGPCVKIMPKLSEWSEKYGDDLTVVGITDEEGEKVERFASRLGVKHSLTSDPNRTLASQIGISVVPYMILIGRDGTVLWQGTSNDGDPLTEAMLRRVILSGR